MIAFLPPALTCPVNDLPSLRPTGVLLSGPAAIPRAWGGGTMMEEGQPEIPQIKRYGVRQAILLVPFLVIILAILQEFRSHRKTV